MKHSLKHFFLSILIIQSVGASGSDLRLMEKAYQEGKSFDDDMNKPSLDALKSQMTGFNHYKGKDVSETNLRAEELEEKSKQKLEAGRRSVGTGESVTPEGTFMTSYLNKKNISVSGAESFIKEADVIAEDPLKHIDENAQFNEVKEEIQTKQWEETCFEKGQSFEMVDTTYLSHVALVEKKKESQGLSLVMRKTNFSDSFEILLPTQIDDPYVKGYGGYENIGMSLYMRNLSPEGSPEAWAHLLGYAHLPGEAGTSEIEKKFFNEHDFYGYVTRLNVLKNAGGNISLTSHIQQALFYEKDSSRVQGEISRLYGACEKNAYFRRQHHVSVSSQEESQNDAGWSPTSKEDFLLGSQDLGIEQDIWSKQDEGPEILADQGICHYVSSSCVHGHDTRLVNGVSVTRPCWAKRRIYQCEFTGKETCAALRKKGCYQVDSKCVQKVGDRCSSFEQKFVCREKIKTGRKTVIKGKIPFCLDGKCHQVSWEPNKDLTEALSILALLKQISKDLDANTRTIFKGEALGCVRHCASFSSCCGVGSGWGVSVGLTKCSEDERRLSKIRGEGKCVLVGTYCAEKVLGVCIRKKTNFCCFGSKLARVFHEEARKQLRMGFGSAERPACQGITFDQLAGLDFSRIDLSEIFNDLNSSIVQPNCSNVSEKLKQDWIARMPSPVENSSAKTPSNMAQHIHNRQTQQHPRSVDRTLNYEHANNDFTPPEKDTNEVIHHEKSKLVF